VIFTRATIRLTVAFAAVQLVLFAAFAIGVYAFVTGTFDFDAAETDSDGAVNVAERGFDTLRTGLIVSYAALIVVVPVASYFMARAALMPIRLSYERQQRFVDGASHELRTPLSIIQGELELVVRKQRTIAEYEDAIDIALQEIDGLTRLSDDLLVIAQSDGPFPLSLEARSLNSLVTEAAHHADASQRSDHPALTVALGADAAVMVSPSLAVRAIVNIIDNAVKFTPAGGMVIVGTGLLNGDPAVTVTDTGMGMDADATAHATERFWRAAEARSRPGHGVGLALVRQVMDAHGGTLTITSTVGRGTVARLVFQRGHR
jgi:signal transduction histidine kinase